MTSRATYTSAEAWLQGRVGETPQTSLGWFRAGVGFYNKREFHFSIECFQRSVQLDPLNYNAFQIMARACIAVNRRDDAIEALKQVGWRRQYELQRTYRIAIVALSHALLSCHVLWLSQSVKLDNPSDWQLLVELTAQEKAAKRAQANSESVQQATGGAGFGESQSASSLSAATGSKPK
jgi:tetratricopeptide (TPR) repeat protein